MPHLRTGSPTPQAAAPPAGDGCSDAELVALAQRDPHAFALLYDRYLDPVYRYCYRRLGSRHAAEDATSLVFTKALAALPRYRHDAFRAWLFTIAHHVITDRYRALHPEQPLADAVEILDRDPSPEDLVLAAEERHSVHSLLKHLPEHQRQVIELRLAGLSGAEIAQILGRSRANVDVTQFRAVARLRVLLGAATTAQEARDAE